MNKHIKDLLSEQKRHLLCIDQMQRMGRQISPKRLKIRANNFGNGKYILLNG
ncbi:MAG: hypothetical protein ACMUIU_03560 [bacterium]